MPFLHSQFPISQPQSTVGLLVESFVLLSRSISYIFKSVVVLNSEQVTGRLRYSISERITLFSVTRTNSE